MTFTRSGGSGGPLDLLLTATPTRVDFSLDDTCKVPSATVSFAAGSSTTQAWLHGRSSNSETVTVTALSAGGPPVSRTTVALPLVRRGRCTLLSGQSSARCPVPIPGGDISRTFLIAQPVSPQLEPLDATAACHLETTPAGSAELVCTRMGTIGPLVVGWQTASHGRPASRFGWSVRHLSMSNLGGNNSFLPLTPTVSRDQAFVLGNFASSGTVWNSNNHAAFSLDNTTVTVRINGAVQPPNRVTIQVVEASGLLIRHDNRGSPALPFTTNAPANLVGTPFFALLTTAFDVAAGSTVPCRYALDAQLTPTGVTVSRTSGAPCNDADPNNVAVQLLTLPSTTVAQHQLALAEMELTKNLVLPGPVEGHRTLVLLPGVGSGGYGVGGLSDATMGGPGAIMCGTELLGPSTIAITRGMAVGTLTVRPTVIEFSP